MPDEPTDVEVARMLDDEEIAPGAVACASCGSSNTWWDNVDGWTCGNCWATDADE